MDFALSEEQEMLRQTARAFLEKECPKSLVRAMEQDEKGYQPELWQKMADLGWTGLVFPQEYGGMEGNFLDLTVLIEEMGRSLIPSPFVSSVVCCGMPILEYGTAEQKTRFLPLISRGEAVFTLALNEPGVDHLTNGVKAVATAQGDGYIISGAKIFVPDAHVADYLLCAARTLRGAALFLVDARSDGVTATVLRTIASDKQCEVVLDNVKVPGGNVLGTPEDGWGIVERIMALGAVAECALMLGSAQQMLEMSVQYAKERVQFDKPIGSFQAIQHKLANMAIDVDGARFATYKAAWKLARTREAAADVSIAKAWVSDACTRVCSESHQVHGGIGFTVDHDLQLYSRRAGAAAVAFGDSDHHREVVAKHVGI